MTVDRLASESAANIRETADAMPLADMRDVARYRRRWAAVSAAMLTALVLIVLIGGAGLLRNPAYEPDVVEHLPGTTIANLVPEVPVVLPTAATCPAGSNPDQPGPVDQDRPEHGTWAVAAVDYQSGQLIVQAAQVGEFGESRGRETWAFDLCTNTWQVMSPEVQPTSMSGPWVYAAASDLIVGIDSEDRVWTYDYDTDTWEEKGEAPVAIWDAAYDSTSDTVVAVGIGGWMPARSWTYDVATDTWSNRSNLPLTAPRHSFLMTYDPAIDRTVAWVRTDDPGYGEVTTAWLYDNYADEWTQATTDTDSGVSTGWGVSGGIFAHHNGTGLSVMYAASEYATFDGVRQAWTHRLDENLRDTALDRWDHAFVYDAVNDRLVLVGGVARMDEEVVWVPIDDVWAYQPATEQWTNLLPPSDKPHPND